MITKSENLLCVCNPLFCNSMKDYEYNNKYHYMFLRDSYWNLSFLLQDK